MKFRYLFTVMVLLSLVLSACAQPGAAPSPTSAQPSGGETSPAGGEPTEAPVVGETPSGGEASGETLKVAILAPLTGPVPTFGASTRDGALLAINEWNAKGGVLGRQVEAVVADSQCTPDPAVNAANQVINQDGVKYIIGEVCSSASIPVSEVTEAAGVLQISPTSTNPQVTLKSDGSTKQYVFRACFTDEYQGQVEAKFALENLGAKTAFVLYDQGNDYTVGLAQYFSEAFTAGGGEIVGEETYTAQDTDFSAILTKVSEANPDILLIPDYYNIVNLVGSQAKQMGITATMLGGDGWDSPDLDAAAAEGGYFTNHYAPDEPRDIVQNFVSNYNAQYGSTPDALAALAYDATNMLLQAIETTGVDDPTQVADTIANGTFDSVSGTITLDEQHNPVKTVTILQVEGGEVKFLTQVNP